MFSVRVLLVVTWDGDDCCCCLLLWRWDSGCSFSIRICCWIWNAFGSLWSWSSALHLIVILFDTFQTLIIETFDIYRKHLLIENTYREQDSFRRSKNFENMDSRKLVHFENVFSKNSTYRKRILENKYISKISC